MAMATLTILPLICLCTVAYTLENLALGKEAQMSSQRSEAGADAAVDGNATQTEDSGTCALTDLRDTEAWWSVDLNGTFAITQLTIFLLNTNIFRFRYYSVHVTGDLDNWKSSVPCAEDHHTATGPQTSVVQVKCDAKGRHVTLWLNRPLDCKPDEIVNFCDILQLCEVHVLGCQHGNYSQNCNMTCPANCRDDVCAIDNGKCHSCKDGYLGDNCDQECDPGRFGQNCHENCSVNCKNICSNINGFCPDGCVDGYEGKHCNKTCSIGRYGSGCNESCGHCLNNTVCDVFSGQCRSGCESGWIGRTCKTSCPDGTYGFQCNGECGQNCLSACNKSTGLCDVGCGYGWKGSYCNESCPEGSYGQGCVHRCSGNCKDNDVCSKYDGSCPHGCDRGWMGPLCNAECTEGYSGYNCQTKCVGYCKGDMSCNRVTSRCDEGCKEGVEGRYCNESCGFKRYGVNCSITCDFCDHGCDRVNGECLHKGISESLQGTTFLPWVFFGIACVITVALVIVIILQYRRYEGRRNHDSIPDESFRHGVNTSTNAENQNVTYEELQTQRSERNAYDTIHKQASTYENTALS